MGGHHERRTADLDLEPERLTLLFGARLRCADAVEAACVIGIREQTELFTVSISGRGATLGDCTVWTVRCQRMPNDCSGSRRGAAQLHVRIAAIGGGTF